MKKRITPLIALLILLFVLPGLAKADADLEKIKKNVPKLLGTTNEGTEFVLSFFPPFFTQSYGNDPENQGIFLFIASATTANVRVTVPAKNWEKEITVSPTKVGEVSIPYEIAQASKRRNYQRPPEIEQVFHGCAIIVTSDAPIVCYGMLRYAYDGGGYLGIPVHALGKEYTLASYIGESVDENNYGYLRTSYSAIVGAYDETEFEFTFGGNASSSIQTHEGKSLRSGQKVSIALNKGDVCLIGARGNLSDLTGSHISSNKPVACFSGNLCATIPDYLHTCDYIIEQDMPVSAWGKTYFVSPIFSRYRNSIVRLFAAKDNTEIFRNNWFEQVATISKKCGQQDVGWVEMRAQEGVVSATAFISKDPINVVQYNPSSNEDKVVSDPFQMNVIPLEQYQNKMMFCTPGSGKGMKFSRNFVNLIYKSDTSYQIPNDLEIGTVNSNGNIKWKPIKKEFGEDKGYKFFYSPKESATGDFFCKQIELNREGTYFFRANNRFCAYSYGFSEYDSYGYPTSAALYDFSKTDTVKPIFAYTIDCHGYVPDKSLGGAQPAYVKDMPDIDSLRSNMSIIYFDKEKSYNYEFYCDKFVAGEDRYVEWRLNPIDPQLDAKAFVTFFDRASNDSTVVIEHKAMKLQIQPSLQDFGTLTIGESKKIDFKVKNVSPTAFVNIKNLRLLRGDQGFKLDYEFDPAELIPPGASRTFAVTFTAEQKGEFADSIKVGDDCYYTNAGYVTAKVGTPKIIVADASFPKTSIGKKSAPIIVTIRNVGDNALKITGYKGPALSVFETNLAGFGISPGMPLEIKPNKEAMFNVWFTPENSVAYTDSIVFESDAGRDIDPVCLITGEGMQRDLNVSNVNWLRKRAHLQKYDAAPFNFVPYPAPNEGITFANDGSEEAIIMGVVVDQANSQRPEAFKILKNGVYENLTDNLDALKLSVPASESRGLMVYFDPKVEGEHKLTLRISTAFKEVVSVLEGVGVYPKMKTADVDFAKMIVGDAPVKKLVRFTNENWGPFADSLTITSIKALPDGAISTTYDQSKPGSEGFAYSESIINSEGNPVTLPATLQPGEYVSIPAEFIALQAGLRSASLSAVSDADTDRVSVLSGIGLVEAISGSSDVEPSICDDDTAVITVKYENGGGHDFVIDRDKLYIEDDVSNSFSIIGVSVGDETVAEWRNGFTIPSGKAAKVFVKYDPVATSGENPHTAKVVLNTDAIDAALKRISVTVSGRANHFELKTAGKLNAKEFAEVRPVQADGLIYSLYIDGCPAMPNLNVTEYTIRIWHKRDFLDVRKDGGEFHIYKGDGLPSDWSIVDKPTITLDEATNEQTIDVKLRGATKIARTTAFEALRVEFFAFLPWYKSTGPEVKSKDSLTTIRHYVADNEACADYVTPLYPTAELLPVCASNIRSIEFSTEGYSLSKVVPNPIDARGGEIKFSTAFDDEVALLQIFNSNNELVATLVDGAMKSGEHTARIPIETLASGVYTCCLTVGPFKASERLLIGK